MSGTKKQRICAWCRAGISETRPVYLVQDYGGMIIGPFHAGCAERLKIEAGKRDPRNPSLMPRVFGTWPTVREETLPE